MPVGAALSTYLDALDIDARFLPLFLVYHRVELVLRRLDQRRVQGQSALAPGEDNPEVPVVHLLTRHAERLFDDVVPAAR